MRIWHEKLIPKLCRQHLLAMWREGLGCYSVIVNNKKGYSRHPAVLEFKNGPYRLRERLELVRLEMIKRGYKPKPLPPYPPTKITWMLDKPWQNLAKQRKVLRSKGCGCQV